MGIKRVVKKSQVAEIVTIGEAYNSFVEEKKARVAEATLKNYNQSLGYFKDYAGFTDETDIKEITRDVVTRWVNTMSESELSPAAINHYLRDCRAFIYWCMKDDRKYIEHFTIEQVKGQEPKKKTYKEEELKKLLAKPKHCNDCNFVEWRNWAIANLAYDMGARCSSLINIQMQDINMQRRTIYLRHTKNNEVQIAVISTQCMRVLKEYIKEYRADAEAADYLFCNYGNEQLTYNALAHSYTQYCKNRKVERHSLHSIRHTFATALAENTGGDMIKVQKALGHKSIDMARKYIDLANVSMGDYDEISPLARTKDRRGRPKRKI